MEAIGWRDPWEVKKAAEAAGGNGLVAFETQVLENVEMDERAAVRDRYSPRHE